MFIAMKINLHSHTQFCDARSSMEDILRAAKEAGFTIWGFSPHAPICVESPCNMKKESVKDYLREINRLRQLFPDIRIFAGMEVDYIDVEHGPSSAEVKEYGLDYVIGSVHFIPNQKGVFCDVDGSPERFKQTLLDNFDNDLEYVVRTFWNQTQEMIKRGGMDIIGHIDKIALNASFVDPEIENSQSYRLLAAETIGMAVDKRYKIEINTKHWEKYGRFFPNPKYWERILSAGIEMPVNSDTHYADRIESGIGAAQSILKEISDRIDK